MDTVYPLISTSHTALPGVLDSIFYNDAMTPQQWAHHWHHASELDPEHRLILAVLEDAIRCAKSPHVARYKKTPSRDKEAELWFKDTSTRPFSFIWCCEHVGWNPDAVRQGIAGMERKKKFGRRRANVRYGQISANRE